MSELWEGLDKDDKMENMVNRILVELQNATFEASADSTFVKTISQLSDIGYMKRMLKNVESASLKSECDLEKREVIKGLIIVTWLQRIYSLIRSLMLGLVAATILLPLLLYFGSLTIIHNIIIFFPIFIFGLIITRLLDNQIVNLTKKTAKYLSNHKRLRNLVMDYF